jgi:hypothetical protein
VGKKTVKQYDTLPTQINFNNVPVNSNDIPESFNKYFLSVADSIISNIPNNCNPSDRTKTFKEYLSDVYKVTFPKIKISPVSTNEIVNIINKMKLTNSYGYDEIPIKILKNSVHYISSPLAFIINRSLTTGIFPDRLKFSEIKPIYKRVRRILSVIIGLYHY